MYVVVVLLLSGAVLAEEKGRRKRPRSPARFPQEFRSIEGTHNNLSNPEWGSADIPFLRLTTVSYADGVGLPMGQDQLSARVISNECAQQEDGLVNQQGISDLFWQWGQFLDHDIALTPVGTPAELLNIHVPTGDPWFDPNSSGVAIIPFERSYYEIVDGVRQQVNAATAYVDASHVYGSHPQRALQLRTLDGTGRLKTSGDRLLPFNNAGLENVPDESPDYFLAGDVRANEQVGLTALHTLFVREHNYWAELFGRAFPQLDGERIYQYARAIVGAEMQAITYREFLPTLLGEQPLSPYRGYDPGVDAGISNAFATAAFRFGHSMLSPQLLRIGSDGQPVDAGHLSLSEAFFSPNEVVDHGIDSLLRGLAAQPAQAMDNYLVGEIRNFLFGSPGAGGFDLAALNIQRGRDHGLARYNQLRIDLGLLPVTSFVDISPEETVQADLAAVYATVDDIDAWVGGLAEPPLPEKLLGETWTVILEDQFERLRDGDRFWYQSYLPRPLVSLVEQQTLARIIRRNTGVGSELQDNPFRVRLVPVDEAHN